MDNLPTHEENPPTYDEATNKANNPPSYKEATTNTSMQTTLNHTQPTSNFNIQQHRQDQNNADFSTVYSNHQINKNIEVAIIVTIICIFFLVFLLVNSLS